MILNAEFNESPKTFYFLSKNGKVRHHAHYATKLVIEIWRAVLQIFELRFTYIYIQAEAHKVLQSDSTQIIDHVLKCFGQKFQCSRSPSYWTTLFFYRVEALKLRQGQLHFFKCNDVFFSMTLLPILRRIQLFTTQGHSSHAMYENSWKIETYRNNHFQRIH